MGYSIRIFSMHYQGNRFFPWFWINKKFQELNGPAAFHPKIINMKWGLKAWNAQPFLLVMHPMNDMQSCLNGCINITFTKFLASLFKLMKAQVFLFETMLSNQLPNGGLSFPCLVIGKRRIKQSPSNLAMRESNWDRSMTTKKRWDEACTVSSTCLHGELLAFTLELEACINIYIYINLDFLDQKNTHQGPGYIDILQDQAGSFLVHFVRFFQPVVPNYPISLPGLQMEATPLAAVEVEVARTVGRSDWAGFFLHIDLPPKFENPMRNIYGAYISFTYYFYLSFSFGRYGFNTHTQKKWKNWIMLIPFSVQKIPEVKRHV